MTNRLDLFKTVLKEILIEKSREFENYRHESENRCHDIELVIEHLKNYLPAGFDPTKADLNFPTNPCPKCSRHTIVHYHELVGGAEYYDAFEHKCLNPACDYSERQDLYGGSFGDTINKCPFCKTDQKQ